MTRIKPFGILAVVALALTFAGATLAQQNTQAIEDHMATYRAKVMQKRDSAMETLLSLNDDQKKVFRPLQKGYDKEIKALARKERAVLQDFAAVYDKLNADSAKEIGRRFFDLKRERLAIQENYLKQISEEVSPVTAVLFIQLQRRFELQLETERSKYSPLAE